MEAIKVKKIADFNTTIISFFGIIDNQIKDELLSIFHTLSDSVILDFSRSERINSMGITVLLKTLKEFHGKGGTIFYVSLTRLNNKLFRMVGLTKLGKILENLDDAMNYISGKD